MGAVVVVVVGVVLLLIGSVAALFTSCREQAEQLENSSFDAPATEPSENALADIPGDFLKLYREAADEYGIDWALLAAVGKQESDHGRASSGCETSEDAARGPMQFIPSTWQSEAVDGDGDGTEDPCDPDDAIHTGGSYLESLAAASDAKGALCSYYGACADANADYANEVLAQAEEYRGAEQESGSSGGGTSPDSSVSSASEPPSDSGGSSGGSGQPPSGWDLVDDRTRTMTYYSESRFDSYVEAAVEEWDSLGGVSIDPADSAASADVVYRDVESEAQWEYGPAAGFTHTTGSPDKGEILLFAPKMESFDETDRKALVVHETGHAHGFEHQNGKHSVMDQGWGDGFRSDTPTELDVRIYRETWGGSGSPADVDPSATYGEEQMSEECTYGFWPWS